MLIVPFEDAAALLENYEAGGEFSVCLDVVLEGRLSGMPMQEVHTNATIIGEPHLGDLTDAIVRDMCRIVYSRVTPNPDMLSDYLDMKTNNQCTFSELRIEIIDPHHIGIYPV